MIGDLAMNQSVARTNDAKVVPHCIPIIRTFDEIPIESVDWLWPQRIARGKVTVIVGDPGVGKSVLTLDIAARVSKGDGWPGCPNTKRVPGNALLISAEDNPGDTIKPRLLALGASMSRVAILEGAKLRDDKGERDIDFDLEYGHHVLEAAILERPGTEVVIIDPVSAYVGGKNTYKDSDVRRLLSPLAALAAKHNVAIIAITHLTKGQGNAIQRTMGSVGFTAAPRAVWLVAKDPSNPDMRVFAPIKNNLGPDDAKVALAYIIEGEKQITGIRWYDDPVIITANELVSVDSKPLGRPPKQETKAKVIIERLLANGPCEANRVFDECKLAGISPETVNRAKRDLGIVSRPRGFQGHQYWHPPRYDDSTPAGEAFSTVYSERESPW
jgi:putative DNA primase/helicase